MFQIHTKVDYGLILLRSLALQSKTSPVSLRVIAVENKLPYRYLTQIAIALKQAGVITSFEGAGGGYRLKQKPSAITLYEIAAILTPRKKLNRCLVSDNHAACARKKTCSIYPWWLRFDLQVQTLLKKTKLSDLL